MLYLRCFGRALAGFNTLYFVMDRIFTFHAFQIILRKIPTSWTNAPNMGEEQSTTPFYGNASAQNGATIGDARSPSTQEIANDPLEASSWHVFSHVDSCRFSATPYPPKQWNRIHGADHHKVRRVSTVDLSEPRPCIA